MLFNKDLYMYENLNNCFLLTDNQLADPAECIYFLVLYSTV